MTASNDTSSSHGPVAGPSGMLAHYSVELWGHDLASLDQIQAALNRSSVPNFVPGAHTPKALSYVSASAADDGGPPPQWTIQKGPTSQLEHHERVEVEQAVMQSWWFREAAEVVGTCTERLVLTDHLHTGLDYQHRLRDLQRLITALIETVGGEAVWWKPSQQFLHPRAVSESLREDDFASPLPGGVNVRYYDVPIDASEDEGGPFKLMDTLGLGALGLTDLEIRYRGLDPEAVSQVLFNTALYFYNKGPLLREGETIQGPGPNDRWLCTRGTSLSEPEREIWSLDPGAPFSVEPFSVAPSSEGHHS